MAYDVIVADPPWTYRDKAKAGARGAEDQYPCLSLTNLAALDVRSVAAPDCALFLWATPPLLPDALELIRAWGFTYKTVAFVWVKRGQSGKLAWGMGSWTRANAEMVLLATRGRPKRFDAGVHQVVEAPLGSHSSKPEEVQDRIEMLFAPDVRRLELFARRKRALWTCTGLDSDGVDVRSFLVEDK
jgi:N6-adenosine-specific RNA methylase IME4